MDVNNTHLRILIDRTDEAFKQLLKQPSSSDLNNAYESAKAELDHYLVELKLNGEGQEPRR